MAFAGGTEQQLVGWLQRLNIEPDRGIAYLLVSVGQQFEAAVVRRDDCRYALLVQKIDDACGDGGTLLRVCADAEFVQKHQRVPRGLIEDAHDVRHMGGEC